jgi:enolase
LVVSISVERAGASTSNLQLYRYIALLAGKQTNKFVMPIPSFNIINGRAFASSNSLDM